MKIVKAEDLQGLAKIHALIYSPPGVGKTDSIRTMPGNVFVIDVFENTNDMSHIKPNAVLCQLEQSSEMFAILDKVKESDKYDWLVIDSISNYARMIVTEAKAKEVALGSKGNLMRAYGTLQDTMLDFFWRVKQLDLNVVCIAQCMIGTNELTGAQNYAPLIEGKASSSSVPHAFNILGYVSGGMDKAGNYKAQIHVKPSENIRARSSACFNSTPVVDLDWQLIQQIVTGEAQ